MVSVEISPIPQDDVDFHIVFLYPAAEEVVIVAEDTRIERTGRKEPFGGIGILGSGVGFNLGGEKEHTRLLNRYIVRSGQKSHHGKVAKAEWFVAIS
jgi:hypothetical protein